MGRGWLLVWMEASEASDEADEMRVGIDCQGW